MKRNFCFKREESTENEVTKSKANCLCATITVTSIFKFSKKKSQKLQHALAQLEKVKTWAWTEKTNGSSI
jgi:hypothetical protein